RRRGMHALRSRPRPASAPDVSVDREGCAGSPQRAQRRGAVGPPVSVATGPPRPRSADAEGRRGRCGGRTPPPGAPAPSATTLRRGALICSGGQVLGEVPGIKLLVTGHALVSSRAVGLITPGPPAVRGGRNRDRTYDLCDVNAALVPTELCARTHRGGRCPGDAMIPAVLSDPCRRAPRHAPFSGLRRSFQRRSGHGRSPRP